MHHLQMIRTPDSVGSSITKKEGWAYKSKECDCSKGYNYKHQLMKVGSLVIAKSNPGKEWKRRTPEFFASMLKGEASSPISHHVRMSMRCVSAASFQGSCSFLCFHEWPNSAPVIHSNLSLFGQVSASLHSFPPLFPLRKYTLEFKLSMPWMQGFRKVDTVYEFTGDKVKK